MIILPFYSNPSTTLPPHYRHSLPFVKRVPFVYFRISPPPAGLDSPTLSTPILDPHRL